MTRNAARQAMEWLGAQLGDLGTIRNATARDQTFKTWRQSTLTILQRVWPADQDRIERFRRIPFSPADPRADVRTTREWYSRGCQEAARVLTRLIEDVRMNGVAEGTATELSELQVGEFDSGFPTVDLPGGESGADAPEAPMPDPEEPPVDRPRPKSGLNMKSRLRELLGFAHLSAKAVTNLPPADEDPTTDTVRPGVPNAPTWNPPPGDGSNLMRAMRAQGPTPPGVPAATPAQAPAPAEPTNRSETEVPSGASVSMSRPTTLRGNIEKVSIESLLPTLDADVESEAVAEAPDDLEALTESNATPQLSDDGPARPTLKLIKADKAAAEPAVTPRESAPPAAPPRLARAFDESELEDPDAIAVSAMTQELARLGVPVERQAETRARLADLARRIERGQIEWSSLRKAVWFAMEYPEVARRLLPVLLPWIEKAA